jgi:Ca2+/Na+ antiporter
MSTDLSPRRSAPFGTLLLLALAFALYVATLAHVSFSAGGGDASMGEALAAFFFTVALWIDLALLMAAGAVMGEMPRWAAVSSFLLVPMAGFATFVAIDMCSRHIKWAVIVPVLLPLLVALYAMWARLPNLRAAIPAKEFSMAVWGAILALSLAAFWFAM